jgi:FkbM family methyltransferase
METLEQICQKNNIITKNGKIVIPDWVQHIKLDIGLSYSAPQSNVWLNNQDNLLVFGFEPNPDSCKSILSPNNKKKHYGHGDVLQYKYITENKFKLLPIALSDKNGILDFYVTEKDEGCSSLFRPVYDNIKSIIKVPIYTLADFFQILPENLIIEYIKIDAQGSDLDIIKGGGKYISERVLCVTLEAENQQYYGTNNHVNKIIEYMESINFELCKHPNTDDPTFFNRNFSNSKNIFIYQKG